MPHICFIAIVRDEAHVILRCLESIRPLADSLLIIDTGSTDGTPDVIARWMAESGLPGRVLHRSWRDFGHNRNELLEVARALPGVDYLLTIDADETLIYDEGFEVSAFKAGLTCDWYDIDTLNGAIIYPRAQLISTRLPFRYAGVLHAALVPVAGMTRSHVQGLRNIYGTDGARSRDPDKFRKGALELEAALEIETDPDLRRRYVFYLAQSWRDAGEPEKALARYLDRAEMGGGLSEQYVALVQAARLKSRLGAGPESLLGAFLHAHDRMPERAEALYGAVLVCRKFEMNRTGYMLARQGLAIAQPRSGLFLEPAVYRWQMADEFHLAAWQAGALSESLEAAEHLLSLPDLPDDARTRIAGNRELLTAKIGWSA